MNPQPEYAIYELVQSYIKQYPDHARLIRFDSPIQTRIGGYELINPESAKPTLRQKEFISSDSLRKTKRTISDIILCNQFDLFCTFTFDPKKVDRYNSEVCKRTMSKWLNNQREIHGNFNYLIVPEWHKDLKALHFHALFKDYRGKLAESNVKKTTKTSRKIYNINSYRSGFSTAVKIDNHEKVSSYIKKYITKDMPLFPGRKRYWCSTGLTRPLTIRNPQIDPYTLAEFRKLYNKDNFTIYKRDGNVPLLTLNRKELSNGRP